MDERHLPDSAWSAELTYDPDGNMTGGYTKDGHRFNAAYDAEDRLSIITYTDGSSVTHTMRFFYRFDGFLYRQIVVYT